MKLIALKDLPNRVRAGESFDTNEIMGRLLTRLKVARPADDPPAPRRSTYRRRDLRAEDPDPSS